MKKKAAIRLMTLLLAVVLLAAFPLSPARADLGPLKKISDEGLEMVNALPLNIAPKINTEKVIGYSYYNTLPKWWGALQHILEGFKGNLIRSITYMGEKQYYFNMALMMCARNEPVEWLNEDRIRGLLGEKAEYFTFDQILDMMDLVADEVMENVSFVSDAVKGVKFTKTGVHAFCDMANKLIFLDSIDWEQMRVLATAWAQSKDYTLKEMGFFLQRLANSTEGGRATYAVLSAITSEGLDTILSEVLNLSLRSVAGVMTFTFQAAVFGVDMLTRFSVLSGNFSDMECAAKSLEACRDMAKFAVGFYQDNAADASSEGNEFLLTDMVRTLIYSGINYAHACAIMNGTYADYVEVGKNSVMGSLYINDTMISRAERAAKDQEKFVRQAEDLQDLLDRYNRAALRERTVPLSEAEVRRLFASVSDFTFLAASGAGAWEGRMILGENGSFAGYYYDEDDGVIYQVSFTGAFSKKAGMVGNAYRLQVDRVKTHNPPGTTAATEYGDSVIYEEPPFHAGDYMLLTLPGTPDDEIPGEVQGEIGGTFGEWEDYSHFYTLTRWDDGWGFFADDRNLSGWDPDLPVSDYDVWNPGQVFTLLSGRKMFSMDSNGDSDTTVRINPDGSFTGIYTVSGGDGPADSLFTGAFDENIEWIGRSTAYLTVKDCAARNDPGTGAAAAPFRPGERLFLTLPGTEFPDDIPEEVRKYVYWTYDPFENYLRSITLNKLEGSVVWWLYADLDYPDTSEITPADPASPASPDPAPGNNTASWTGYWMTRDDIPNEMIITDNGNGTLHMKALFLRSMDLDADLSPADDRQVRVTVGDNMLSGDLVRRADGSLHLKFDDGWMVEDEESEASYFFSRYEFDFFPAAEADLWYDGSGIVPDSSEWLGTWQADGARSSTLRITGDGAGGMRVSISVENGPSFSAALEPWDDRLMFFETEEINGILELNRKHRIIMLSDVGAMADEISEWLDETGWMVEYRYTEGETISDYTPPENDFPDYTPPAAPANP